MQTDTDSGTICGQAGGKYRICRSLRRDSSWRRPSNDCRRLVAGNGSERCSTFQLTNEFCIKTTGFCRRPLTSANRPLTTAVAAESVTGTRQRAAGASVCTDVQLSVPLSVWYALQ